MLDRDHLGVLDILARRNAFGRQLRSFEADLDIDGVPGARSTRCSSARRGWPSTAPEVEVLAERRRPPGGHPPGQRAARSFHPELTGETRLHELLLAIGPGRADAAQDARAATAGSRSAL